MMLFMFQDLLLHFSIKKGKVFAFVNDKIFETKELKYPQRDRFSLNFEYAYNNDFELFIPITSKILKSNLKRMLMILKILK